MEAYILQKKFLDMFKLANQLLLLLLLYLFLFKKSHFINIFFIYIKQYFNYVI